MRGDPRNPVRQRRLRSVWARLHHQPPPAAAQLPTPLRPYLEVIAAFPTTNPDNVAVHVLRDLTPQAFTELAADITAATQRGDSLEPLLACWAAIQ